MESSKNGSQGVTFGGWRKEWPPREHRTLQFSVESHVGGGPFDQFGQRLVVEQREIAGVTGAQHSSVAGHPRSKHRNADAGRLANNIGPALHD